MTYNNKGTQMFNYNDLIIKKTNTTLIDVNSGLPLVDELKLLIDRLTSI